MTEVFQPLNDRAAEVITKNADLLEGSAMEPLLLQLVAHVFAYRVIIKRCDLPPSVGGDPIIRLGAANGCLSNVLRQPSAGKPAARTLRISRAPLVTCLSLCLIAEVSPCCPVQFAC